MVTADCINAGTMRADRVRAGLLTDEEGENFWDLTTGEFSLSASAEVGGKTVQDIAANAASSAVSAQTQRDIFNKLTNNGQTQESISVAVAYTSTVSTSDPAPYRPTRLRATATLIRT